MRTRLERDVSEQLNHSGIAAVELIESTKQRVARNQIVARRGKAVHAHVVDGAARPLRVIEDVEHLRADVERDRTEILTRAQTRMLDVVKKVSDEKGLDYVVEASAVITFKPALDITNDVVAAYDKSFPAK